MLVDVYKNNKKLFKTTFVDNLSMQGKPAYLNDGGLEGIKRIRTGEYKNKLIYMFVSEAYPKSSFGMFISEEEAYDMCINRNKCCLVDKLKLLVDVVD